MLGDRIGRVLERGDRALELVRESAALLAKFVWRGLWVAEAAAVGIALVVVWELLWGQ